MFFLFLTSGLFLGWSLGANDAANIFGSAVGSKMIKFSLAIFIASLFVILGAFIQGSGTSNTLGELGSVNAIGGAFTVALCAGLTVLWMTKLQLPVSSSQGIIGAIVGWNFYSGNPTDLNVLGKIVGAWIAGPILGAVFAVLLYQLFKAILNKSIIHLLKLDAYLKYGLLIVGAFGAYSLGANNVANVVGVFIPSVPEIELNFGIFSLNGTQLLFLIGGISIAAGITTYSKKVMMTVGNNLMKLSSESALIIVLAHSLVLFVFSSTSLSNLLLNIGLPAIPLVPVSSSQAVVGAIMGIGLLKGGRNIKFDILEKISLGWIATPIIAGFTTFVSLFFMSNVFKLVVVQDESLVVSQKINRLITAPKISDSATEVNLYQPLLFIIIVLLLAIIIALAIILFRKNAQTKAEETSDIVLKYASQENVLQIELQKANTENIKLEKEIEFMRKEQMNIAISIIQKNQFLEKLKAKIDKIILKQEATTGELSQLKKLIIDHLSVDKELERFNIFINELNTDFYLRLAKKYQGLSENEKRLAALIRLNLSSKEIAAILNTSTKSVEVNKHRLRKKMHLKREENLTELIGKL